MTRAEFLVDGHITEYKDIRELEVSAWDWIRGIKKLLRECEKENLDYEEWISKDGLRDMYMQLECVLDHKDNPNIKRRDYEV